MEEQNPNQSVSSLELDTRVFAGLSYLSILFVVPWVAKREDKFVMFHVRQGVTLFLAEVVVMVILWLVDAFLTSVFSFGALTLMQWLSKLAWLGFAGISGVGVYFAVKGVEKQLPILHLFSRNLKI
ncbi:hypothetical protein A2994_02415 [candidate division Kazan bacterium RIFCSPLOWO2_01_FULL_48_13]|uniref:DUF4870 domain-containing protein n=1 Tax=candidate division Kazan bacterium RIFCSPLOWO2_01_FULL_48_13 TaxID=1798539 RepID=A0A1F4PP63_UNCK3|nr:MAG: hypothetical protein A2994_02415 [candidate division Kazan bacterium RIFCSPLOWO2_01_FULL_48_13]